MVVFDPATGRVDSLKTSSTPELARPGDRQRARRGRRRGRRARDVHARDDGRHERADRAHRVQGRVRDHEGLRGHAVHPAHQPQGALRPALAEARAARREPAPLPRARRAPRRRGQRAPAGRRAARCGRSAARSATTGAEAVARLPALLVRQHRARGDASSRSSRRSSPGVPVSVSHEVAPIWREYERSSTTIADAYLRPLFGRYVEQPRRRAARRRHDARVDADEVERRRHALRRGGGRADPDGHVRPGRRHDRDRARRARARRAERAHARHGRHERRRRHPRRREAAAHDRVRDRVGPAGGGPADRHQVDRRRRRLDRLGRRGRLPARRAAQRGRRSRGRSATAAAAPR